MVERLLERSYRLDAVEGGSHTLEPQYAVSRDSRFLNSAIESATVPIVVMVNWMKTFGR